MSPADNIKRIAGMPASQATFREHCILELYCAYVAAGDSAGTATLAAKAVRAADAVIEAMAK